MVTFTLAIFYLTTFKLPCFMDLTSQVLIKYCSLQHWTLLLSPVPSTTRCCFCFDSIPSFFLELFLHWSPVVYWAPTDLGSSSFSVYLFAFSYCSLGSQGKNTEVVCHSLLQWTTFCQIIEKAREFQKNIYFCFIDCSKAFYCVDHNKLWKIC